MFAGKCRGRCRETMQRLIRIIDNSTPQECNLGVTHNLCYTIWRALAISTSSSIAITTNGIVRCIMPGCSPLPCASS
jgi:hypothetical protein